MKLVWGDLNARARGLATHLLRRSELAALSRSPDIPALAAALERHGFPLDDEPGSPEAIELAVRRNMAADLAILARWSGLRSSVLSVVFDDEDRRSLRGILRGTAQLVSAEARLSGALPTPSLPERALEELSRQPAVPRIAAVLVAWGHPYGPPLSDSGGAGTLLEAEVRINRTFAARALRAARKAGRDGVLLSHVREVIDIENTYAALALAEAGTAPPPEVFLPGGHWLSRDAFDKIVRHHDGLYTAAQLSRAFAPSPLAAAFLPEHRGDLERAVLASQITAIRKRALLEPLSPAPVLAYTLRLRAQLMDLRRITWGLVLSAPRASLEAGLLAEV